MALREVKMVKDLVAYHDGFTRSLYPVGTVQAFEEAFASRQIAEGFCVPLVADMETKPSTIVEDIETKPLKLRKRAVKGNNSASE